MINDPIADMLTIIRNGYLAGKKNVKIRNSKTKAAIGEVLTELGFVLDSKVRTNNEILVTLKYYENKTPALTELKRVSSSSVRVYRDHKSIPFVKSGLGDVIISTSSGIMTGRKARAAKLGGEVICKVS